MQHEKKKKLTRNEAIALFSKHMPDVVKADRTIEFYIEAGMLEIVEEKAIVINHVDKGPIIIQRNGKVIYTELDD
jgi:hypothetical protein